MQHIDAELEKRHWSRNELAVRAGLSNSYFTMMAKETRTVGADAASRIARALDLPAETIFEWAGLLRTKGDNPQRRRRAARINQIEAQGSSQPKKRQKGRKTQEGIKI